MISLSSAPHSQIQNWIVAYKESIIELLCQRWSSNITHSYSLQYNIIPGLARMLMVWKTTQVTLPFEWTNKESDKTTLGINWISSCGNYKSSLVYVMQWDWGCIKPLLFNIRQSSYSGKLQKIQTWFPFQWCEYVKRNVVNHQLNPTQQYSRENLYYPWTPFWLICSCEADWKLTTNSG